MKNIGVLLLTIVLACGSSYGQVEPVAYWDFDQIRVERKKVEMVRGETHIPKEVFAFVKESVTEKEHNLNGTFYKEVMGVKGAAVLFDGYTTYIENQNRWKEGEKNMVPDVGDAFTVEAWIALGAYPKNHCPIVDHRRDEADGYYNGYSLEIDALGRLMLKVATNGKYEIAMAEKSIPLNKWAHVAGIYSEKDGLSVYVNGKIAGKTASIGSFKPANPYKTSMLIGKGRAETRPYGTIRPAGTEKSHTFFDGILDELKIYNKALSADDLNEIVNASNITIAPELPQRILPSGPKSPKKFRAVNTSLKYYESWDAPWAIDDNADIVVQFDEADCKFVFWHGTAYIPNWVTENDIWFNNGFNEGWNDHGSCEPMSDKKAKYSTVKIVESNEARVIVQWRYALVDVLGTFAFEDPVTGWGDWTNETFTIYPDMVGVREDKLLSNAPHAAHEWQESIMVMGPGQRPEDVLEYEALSLANISGEAMTYSWKNETPPQYPGSPLSPVIQTVNTKSKYNPFSILRPQDDPKIDVYAGEIRREVSVFPWWNHWPVAPRPTDGRHAHFADRASHASLSHWTWEAYEATDRSMTKVMLNGLTDKKAIDLLPLAQSWSNPATIEMANKKFKAEYTTEEKAYTIAVNNEVSRLDFLVKGNVDSPIVNPAFVIENWGEGHAQLSVNGKLLTQGTNVRIGFRESLNSRDMIVWLRMEESEEISFSIKRNTNN